MKRLETDEHNFIGFDRLDNWKKLSYDKRYLDTLASVLLVNGNNNKVAAVCYHNNKFYLSYNKTSTINDKAILKEIWALVEAKNWKDLLVSHLIYNQIDFQGLLSTYLNFYKNIPLAIEQEVKGYIASINNPNKANSTGKEAIFNNYFKLLENVSNSTEPISEYFKQILFRPLQNVTKLCHFLEHNNITISSDNLIPLENNIIKDLHAELNVKQQFPALSEKYIGVSRLCCAACHEVFEIYQDDHRGTHGVCYHAWQYPIMQFSGVMKSIEDKADTLTDQDFKKSQGTEVEFTDEAKYILETRYKVEQQRDLSDDEDIESEIAITQEINLWQLKQKLGLGQQGNNNLEEESTTNSAHYKNLPNLGNGSLIEEGHYIFIGGQTVLCFFIIDSDYEDGYSKKVLIGENIVYYETMGYFGVD